MGGLQSKSRNKKSTLNENLKTPIKRCSTLTSQDSPIIGGLRTTARFYDKEELPQTPEGDSPKYDPTYILWKNAFEDSKTRTPRKVSPIRGGSSPHVHNITDAVAWQLTPKGFPAYTKLSKKDLVKEKEKENETKTRNSLTKVRRRLSLRETFEENINRKSKINNVDESIENCLKTTLRHADNENKEVPPSERSNINYGDRNMENCSDTTLKNEDNEKTERPDSLHHKFSTQLPAGKAAEYKKFIMELKQVHAEKQKEFGTDISSPKQVKQIESNYFLLQRRPPNVFVKGITHKKGIYIFP